MKNFDFVVKKILKASIKLILTRFEHNGNSYPFIDTKFDIVTNRDFYSTDAAFKRRDSIYGWIQGRGLESLAKHAVWFESCGDGDMVVRLDAMTAVVGGKMEECRAYNGGRIAFAMSPEGKSIYPVESTCANYSDIFYSKGLLAAARRLGNKVWAAEAEKLFRFALDDIVNRRFRTDQHGFDVKNPVCFVPGKFPQGQRMITLYGLADWAIAQPDAPFWMNTAAELIDYIFTYHVNTGRYDYLEMFDFIESIDQDFQPWRDGPVIMCDPGHALEFIGLAAKCLLVMRAQKIHTELIERSGEILPELFRHIFKLGFNPTSGGIVKSFDLHSRRPINSDMPWWNLPEAIRAGRELMALYPERSDSIETLIDMAFQAFSNGFLQPNGFACQTRDVFGKMVNVIPAVPDADPGYHTNLSLIDALSC